MTGLGDREAVKAAGGDADLPRGGSLPKADEEAENERLSVLGTASSQNSLSPSAATPPASSRPTGEAAATELSKPSSTSSTPSEETRLHVPYTETRADPEAEHEPEGRGAEDTEGEASETEGSSEEEGDELSDEDDEGDLKQKGLSLFEKGDFEGAIDCWKRGLRAVNFVLSKDLDEPEKVKEFEQMRMSYRLNLSLGSLKAGHFGACVTYCDDVLDVDPFHLKALFRKAQALHSLGRLEDALAIVDSLLEAHPNNPAAVELQRKLKREVYAYRKKEREMAKAMLHRVDADPRSVARGSAPEANLENEGLFGRMKKAFGFFKSISADADAAARRQASSAVPGSSFASNPPPFPPSPFGAVPPGASAALAEEMRQFGGCGSDANPFASLYGDASPFVSGAPGDSAQFEQNMRDLQRLLELNQRLMESPQDAGFLQKLRLAWAFCSFAGRALFERGWSFCKRRCRETCSRRRPQAPQPLSTASPSPQMFSASPSLSQGASPFERRGGEEAASERIGLFGAKAWEKKDGGKSGVGRAAARRGGRFATTRRAPEEKHVPRFEEVDDDANPEGERAAGHEPRDPSASNGQGTPQE
ncbi:tetratricopeptide repeat-containing protein [Besnoitia besnoiti]|uniref:peptidylprolyl isomerase n=1 Tax=Besnoitia besnoiti TaxID=94643 RepID=A0A2A9MLU9_BESBE|nr:tetratricopeptide repeat-containing protein [Besnoitia besnoiti]PFH36470.1 tetratricopeptide repeat-containing protein [Besnoitia besnoiti]